MVTIASVSLGNNCPSLTWQQLCQCHLGTIVPVSVGNNHANLTWEQLSQCHLEGTIVSVSLGNNRGTIIRNSNDNNVKVINVNFADMWTELRYSDSTQTRRCQGLPSP